jgi:hypothetical protein
MQRLRNMASKGGFECGCPIRPLGVDFPGAGILQVSRSLTGASSAMGSRLNFKCAEEGQLLRMALGKDA